jgi:hypothetical protein
MIGILNKARPYGRCLSAITHPGESRLQGDSIADTRHEDDVMDLRESQRQAWKLNHQLQASQRESRKLLHRLEESKSDARKLRGQSP